MATSLQQGRRGCNEEGHKANEERGPPWGITGMPRGAAGKPTAISTHDMTMPSKAEVTPPVRPEPGEAEVWMAVGGAIRPGNEKKTSED
eukprot:5092293-Amphidinium_carterae.1